MQVHYSFIYTKSDLVCIQHNYLENVDTETIWLEVKNSKQKPFFNVLLFTSISMWLALVAQSDAHSTRI